MLKLPKVANLESYGTLYSQDPEQDFFNNVIHLQVIHEFVLTGKYMHVRVCSWCWVLASFLFCYENE